MLGKKEQELIQSLDQRYDWMVDRLIQWASMDSSRGNVEGIQSFGLRLQDAFEVLRADVQWTRHDGLDLLAPTMVMTKHPHAPIQVLLVCHMDTGGFAKFFLSQTH